MIITTKKHERIVSMKNETIVHLEDLVAKKNEDIKDLEGKLEGNKKLLKDKGFELYESTQNLIARDKELEDSNLALDLMIDKVDELENENEELGDKILNMREDNVDLQKENNEYKKQLDFIKELLRQYKWYIDKTIEVEKTNATLTYKDVNRFHSMEGTKGVMKLYQIASMMQ